MMKTAILVFCLGFVWLWPQPAVVSADAGPTVWTSLGLYGGHVNALAIDLTDPDTLFSGTYLGEGLFRSIDGAANWQALKMDHRLVGEDTFENQSVAAIAIAPSDPQVVWAAHNQWVAKSTDGGDTWTHIRNETMQRYCRNCGGDSEEQFRLCQTITIDPFDADTVYVGTAGPRGAYTNGAIFRTTDGGLTWEKLNGGQDLDYTVLSVALHAQRPGVIWTVTNSFGTGGVWEGTIYMSTDGGNSFGAPGGKLLSGSLSGLTWHPEDPYAVFITGAVGVVRMVIEGSSLNLAIAVPGSALASPVAFAPNDADVVYAAWNRPTGWGGDGLPKISASLDGGLTWETTTVDASLASAPQCLAVDPSRARTLYWGDASGGILKSRDGGQTWTTVNQGLNGIIVRDVDTDPTDGSHLIAATSGGVHERVDGQWQKRLNWDSHAVSFDPVDSRIYYAGLSSVLAKTRDGGQSWAYSSDYANGTIRHIEIDTRDSATLFIADSSHVRRSRDGGDTFTAVLAGINANDEQHDMNVVAIDPSDSQRILAGGGNYFVPRVTGGLWESRDGGDTWQTTSLTDVVVNDALIHPDDPAILFAGCGHSDNDTTPLFKSVDGGATWAAATDGLPPEPINLHGVWVAASGEIVAVGSGGHLLRVRQGDVFTMDAGTTADLFDVFGIDNQSVVAVGDNGALIHFDGTDWIFMDSPTDTALRGVWGFSVRGFYAVGDGGQVLTYDGERWAAMSSPVEVALRAVFGVAADDIIAVGARGTIIRYNGQQWTTMTSPVAVDLSTVWSAGDGHWFAAGDDGTLIRFNGQAWSVMDSGTAADIRAIWGTAADDFFTVTGIPAELRHFDGDAWQAVAVPHDHVSDIWGADGHGIVAVQEQGGIDRYDGSRWETLRAPGSRFRSVTDMEFHRQDADVIYAATVRAGVYISPIQGDRWLNLGTPRLDVNAISVGSLFAATGGGLFQLTGTGLLAGSVTDQPSQTMIHGAQVATDLGLRYATIDGRYMMVAPSGIYDVYATADQHAMAIATDLTVVGGDVTWQDFALPSGSAREGLPGGALTVDRSASGGGAYCFIAAGHSNLRPGATGWAFLLAGGLFLLTWRELNPRLAWLLSAVAIGLLCLVSPTWAFTIFQQVGVTSPPQPVGSGARAMGMGGTFIAIADDATAASWNPAGLVQLERPEVSIVGDWYSRTESYTSEVHPEVANTSRNEYGNINYLSATFPFHWHKNMVVSFNYQRLYDFYRELNYQREIVDQDLQLNQQIQYDQSGNVGAVGLSGGVELTPRFSVGLTANIWTDQLGYDNGWQATYQETATGSQAGLPVTTQTHIEDEYEQFRGINFNLGVMWDMQTWGVLGAVAKTPFRATIQHHFRFDQVQTFGPPLEDTTIMGPIRVSEEVDLYLPWSYGLGWSKRFTDRLTVGVDIYRTEWSDYYLKDGQGEEFSPIDGRPRAESDVDATTHLRIGGEYLLLWPHIQLAVPLRAGFFYDPEPGEGSPRDVYGLALGSGITRSRYSIDLAYQLRWADDIDTGNTIATSKADITQHTLLASLIYYF